MEDKNRNLLKIAGILNILEGTIFCINNKVTVIGLIIIALGVLFINIGKKPIQEQCKDRVLLLIFAIIQVPYNLLSAILLFIVWDSLSNYQKQLNGINAPPEEIEKEVNPEVKKIDILLKLGVGMVFISGVIFATSSWDFISDIFKVIILVLFGALFFGLSYFTENKLKLEKSSFVYWVLSMAFFVLSIIGIEFFGVFGQFLTFTGEGKYLAYFIVMLACGILSNVTYLKYKKKYLIYVVYISYLIATHNIIMQVKPSLIFSLIILSVMNIITYIIDKKDTALNDVSGIFIYILSLLICANIYTEEMITLRLLAAFISIMNIIYLKIKENDELLTILGMLITFILVTVTFASFDMKITTELFLTFVSLTAYSLFNNLKSNKMIITEINNIIYTVFTSIIYINLIENEALIALLVAIIYLVFAITSKFKLDYFNQSKTFNVCLPIVVPMIIFPFADLVGIKDELNYAYGLALSAVFYCSGHYVFMDKEECQRFLVYSIIATILSILASIDVKETFVSILPVATSIYITGVYFNHKIKTHVIWAYILFLISLYIPMISLNVLNINIIFSTIMYIWIILMVMFLFNSDLIKKITEISIVVPIYSLIATQDIGSVFESIATSILILYITFLIIKFFVKENRSTAAIIGIILSLINMIFTTNIYIGLYVGLVGIIVMVMGYNYDEYAALFKFGIGIIILNIIVQLFELWEKVPFPIYLLVTGLGIIGFVTFKEMKKLDNSKEDK